MFFCWDITIPADTQEYDPLESWLKLGSGIITRIDVKFPSGCHGMVKIRVFLESLQLAPLSEDEWVTGDDETVPTETGAELTDHPYKLKFVGCSPDTTYDHTITVRIELKLVEQAGILGLTRLFKGFLEKLGLGE